MKKYILLSLLFVCLGTVIFSGMKLNDWVKQEFCFQYFKGDPQGKYRQEFMKKTGGKTCIGFTVPINTAGDIRTITEKCIAASRLGIDSYIFEFPFYWDNQLRDLTFKDFMIKCFTHCIDWYYKPAFVVAGVPPQYPITSKSVPNFLIVRYDPPPEEFFWKADIRYYDAYVSYQRYGKEYISTRHIFDKFPRPTMYTYSSVAHKDYKPIKFNKIFYPSGNWDKLRTSEKYKSFLSKLSQDKIIGFFGPKHVWNFAKESYEGYISNVGDAFHNKIQEFGIVLVLNAQELIASKTPSGRVFEAAAASAIIISDEHPFIKEEFGDNVLYINTSEDAESIYKQIKKHFEWIQAFPEKAAEKARCAHRIFAEKFAAEKEIVQYLDLYQQVIENKDRLEQLL